MIIKNEISTFAGTVSITRIYGIYVSIFWESQNKTKEDQEAKVEADKDGTVDSVQAEKSQSGDRGLNQCTVWNRRRTERLIDDRVLQMNSQWVTEEKETSGKDVEEPGQEIWYSVSSMACLSTWTPRLLISCGDDAWIFPLIRISKMNNQRKIIKIA